MNGIINVLKPPGMTSHDVVGYLRGLLKMKRIGHTGTLDPDAVGVLPICVGKATKIVEYITEKKKKYRAELVLGIITDTQDISGNIISKNEVNISKEQLIETLNNFIGKINQIPPMYSAIKVNGKKLYELARQGIEIERKAREIEIYNIDLIKYDDKTKTAIIDVECSKGTYIRTLCNDIGENLACGGCMGLLIRTYTEPFDIHSSFTLNEINEHLNNDKVNLFLKPIDDLFFHLTLITVKDESLKWVLNGAEIYEKDIEEQNINFENEQLVKVYNNSNEFLAIYKVFKQNKTRFVVDKILF